MSYFYGLYRIACLVKDYLAPAPASVQGLVSGPEMQRSFVTALLPSSLLGLVIAILGLVQANVVVLFPDPANAALATFVLIHLVDLLRRLNHGEPAPEGAPEATHPAVTAYLATPPGSVE